MRPGQPSDHPVRMGRPDVVGAVGRGLRTVGRAATPGGPEVHLVRHTRPADLAVGVHAVGTGRPLSPNMMSASYPAEGRGPLGLLSLARPVNHASTLSGRCHVMRRAGHRADQIALRLQVEPELRLIPVAVAGSAATATVTCSVPARRAASAGADRSRQRKHSDGTLLEFAGIEVPRRPHET